MGWVQTCKECNNIAASSKCSGYKRFYDTFFLLLMIFQYLGSFSSLETYHRAANTFKGKQDPLFVCINSLDSLLTHPVI